MCLEIGMWEGKKYMVKDYFIFANFIEDQALVLVDHKLIRQKLGQHRTVHILAFIYYYRNNYIPGLKLPYIIRDYVSYCR